MIKAITFDFWNTLYADVNFNQRLKLRIDYFKNKLSEFGLEKPVDEIEKVFEDVGKKWLKLWEEGMSFIPMDITKAILENLGLTLPNEVVTCICKDIGEITLKVPPLLIEGVKEFLREVSKDYKLGLISDTGVTPGTVLRKIMERDQIKQYFRSFVFSDEIRSTKPTKKNFVKALEPLGVDFKNAVHIGDMERTDIAGAKSVGMKTILFTGVAKKDITETTADLVISSYNGLAEILKKM